MDKLFVIVGLALAAVIFSLLAKESKLPVLATFISLAAGIMILLLILPALANIFDVFSTLADRAGLSRLYLGTILKIIAISYIAEFTVQLCKDAGVSAIAAKVDIGAKILVMLLALPVMAGILDTVLRILP